MFNWKIAIALFWDEGNASLIPFIENDLSSWTSFWGPLTSAVGYVLLSPIVKNLITMFQNWNFKWGERQNIKILGGSKISMEKYLLLRESSENQRKKLEEKI